ncbi:hypothetical protein EON65_54500, partial [archaeon]
MVTNYMITLLVDVSLTNALLVLGAWVGCVLASIPSEQIGRRRTLLFNSLIFIAGALLAACTHNKIALFIGRFVS